jgi:hypothetical protein
MPNKVEAECVMSPDIGYVSATLSCAQAYAQKHNSPRIASSSTAHEVREHTCFKNYTPTIRALKRTVRFRVINGVRMLTA